jgi:hypothetical protein
MTFWEFADKHATGLGMVIVVTIAVLGFVAFMWAIAWSDKR